MIKSSNIMIVEGWLILDPAESVIVWEAMVSSCWLFAVDTPSEWDHMKSVRKIEECHNQMHTRKNMIQKYDF